MMKNNNPVVKLKTVNNKIKNKTIENLQESINSIIQEKDKMNPQGYALVVWSDNGNQTRTFYQCRKDFPALYIPELSKRVLVNCLQN